MKVPRQRYSNGLLGLAMFLASGFGMVGLKLIDIDAANMNAASLRLGNQDLNRLVAGALNPIAINSDGSELASIDLSGTIFLHDLSSGQIIRWMNGQFGDLNKGVLLTPSADRLATVGDNSITIWDAKEGLAHWTLQAMAENPVDTLTFDGSGKLLAGTGTIGGITVWDAVSGTIAHHMGLGTRFLGLAFSPDGSLLASATAERDPKLTLWSAATGNLIYKKPLWHGPYQIGPLYSPDGARIAGVHANGTISITNAATGEIERALVSHYPALPRTTFSPDGRFLAIGGFQGKVELLNLVTGERQLSTPPRPKNSVADMVYSADGQFLAAVDEDNEVAIWTAKSGKFELLYELSGLTGRILKMAFGTSAQMPTLAVVAADGQVVVWDVGTGGELFRVPIALLGTNSTSIVRGIAPGPLRENTPVHTSAPTATAPTSDGGMASVAETAQSLGAALSRVSGGASARPVRRLHANARDRKGLAALAVSPDGTTYCGAGKGGNVRLWSASGKERMALKGHHGSDVTGVTFSANGKRVISVGKDSEVQIRDAISGDLDLVFQGHEQPIRSVSASPDGRFVATAGDETRVFLWNAESGKLQGIFSGARDFVNAVSFSPDGRFLAGAGADASVMIWEVATGRLLKSLAGHSGEVNTVAFNLDGTVLASGSLDSQVILWNSSSGQKIAALNGHKASIRTLAFHPNGKTLVSAGEDGQLLVWDTSNGLSVKRSPASGVGARAQSLGPAAMAQVQRLAQPNAPINSIAFDPRGNLIVGDEDGRITELNSESGATVQTIELGDSPQTKTDDPFDSLKSNNTKTAANGAELQAGSKAPRKLLKTAAAGLIGSVLNWLIPAAEAAIPNPPGGPIAIVAPTSASNPTDAACSAVPGRPCKGFNAFYTEILRTEGFNEFAVLDINSVSATTLAPYDVVILVPGSLTATQVDALTNWVTNGGNLVAMRPSSQLASLLGVSFSGATLTDGYLQVDSTSAPGAGIANTTLQFHGTADRFTISGPSTTALAALYSTATTGAGNPAVTLRSVGAAGGQVAAFAYDLATSVVYTRQGNPSWATQERDGRPPIRSDDKFFGAAVGDPQPDWSDLTKVAVPQADEQQRLLANLIISMNLDRKPLPRFWYFPRGEKAVVIMTGDDHGNGGTVGRFNQFSELSPAGCSVDNWECIRGTSYIYPATPLGSTQVESRAQAVAFDAAGFEVGLHVSTGCGNYTLESLRSNYSAQIAEWQANLPGIPAPVTQRHHCIAWSDWTSGAQVQLENSIRLDTSYYYWPPGWVNDNPGVFTGSAMPMRFSALDGTLIDVFQATSQMTDESGQTYPFTINTLLDRAVGAQGYYGAYTINAHTDLDRIPESNAVVPAAQSRSVPVISSRQMLAWLDARDGSSFSGITWNDTSNTLSFSVTPGSSSIPSTGSSISGLQAMIPTVANNGAVLSAVTRNGSPVAFTSENIKGVIYGIVTASAGTYVATYAADSTPPTITAVSPISGASNVSLGAAVTARFSEGMNSASINSNTIELLGPANQLVAANVTYNGATQTATLDPNADLSPLTAYTARVKSGSGGVKDAGGTALAADFSWTFTTEASPCSSGCTGWTSATIPSNPSVNDLGSVELGVKFRSDLNGFITGIRFYKGSNNTGTHIGNLWSATGTNLARATFTNETATGWQQVTFSNPVPITANTVYVASYLAPNGGYAADGGYFATSGFTAGHLSFLSDSVAGGNGVFVYSGTSGFPTQTFNSTNYWVDVTFTTSSTDTTPPTVTLQSPTAGTAGVTNSTTVTATFSEPVNSTTISTTTFELRGPGNNLITASISYDSATRTATLTPISALALSTQYTARIIGGPSGVKDSAGNPMASDNIWTFTTGSGASAGCGNATSIWPGQPSPIPVTDTETSSVNLGVKFQAASNGFICGIRFYKGSSSNSGTHLGTLWSAAGVKLAEATFSNETATGWQQVLFTNPVAIAANTTYVASYLAPVGRYSANNDALNTPVTNGALSALGSAASGGNGVYLYSGVVGFPTSSFLSSNYWVDVLFTSSIGPDTTPPTVASTVPANNAANVVPGNAITVTFSESMDPTTIGGSAFTLRNSANVLIASTVTYDAATRTATLTPSSVLNSNATYNATVSGGSGGVKDVAGNALASNFAWSFTTGIDPCQAGGNPIVCENAKVGNSASEWDVGGAGDPSIQGFATDISYNKGGTVSFKISTPATTYRLDIYRMGYYGGAGARKVATINGTGPRNQPACLTNTTGLIDCGNWTVTTSWPIPSNATSGIYFAKATRTDTGGASHIVFIVRDDLSTSDILFQTSDTTWQAYNNFGGNSLYQGTGPGTGGSSAGRAYKVSYNRPFSTRSVDNGQDWVFNAEYPMVRWLEANGYNVSYFTGVDSDRLGNLIRNHKLFLSVGHDEYWSGQQRTNLEAARDLDGVNLAFFSGNEVFWKTRWENSIDGSPTAHRTLVCYKETHNYPINPDPTAEWTGTWRDPRGTPPADGGRPENALQGTIFMVNDGATTSITVPAVDGKMRFWRNTSIASLTAGASASLPNGTLGYEWDNDLDNGFRPAGLIRLSTSIVNNAPILTDFGSSFGSGVANHALTLYRASSGALVFGAGTVQWSWGLDSNHDRTPTPTDVRMQQATVNLFADMGVQPTTLQTGLVTALASTDATAPTSTISSPASGVTIVPGSAITISGTAADRGGSNPAGVVGGVEVSINGGAWHPAVGRESWTYSWTANPTGTVTIRTRAVDDSGNLELPGPGISVNVSSATANTGFRFPGANAAVTANAGDNNGFEIVPLNAFSAIDNSFAVDANSGNTTSTVCTNAGKDKHSFSNYGFSIPSTAAILGIEVRLVARVNSTLSTPTMCVELSADGGVTWTAASRTANLATTAATYTLGGVANTWGRTWTPANLSNANFRVRITNSASSTARTFSLDAVSARVTYR